MRVLIDIGNTRIKWAIEDPAAPPGSSLDAGEPVSTRDGIRTFVRKVETVVQPTSVVVSSVASADATDWLMRECVAAWAIRPVVAKVEQSAHGVVNAYRDPAQMGVDRWVALIGARYLTPRDDVVVVDAGTAITVDTLDQSGVFRGGLIMPGVGLARRALRESTSRIDADEDAAGLVLDPFGQETGECVERGARFAAVGGVLRAVFAVEQHLGRDVRIMLTGGAADMLHQHLGRDVQFEPHLVLIGLSVMSR